MRLIRFLALFAILVAVYLAQYIFDHRTLIDFFPQWFLNAFPAFYSFSRWLPGDLLTLAALLATVASVGFGLLTTQWMGECISFEQPDDQPTATPEPTTDWLFGVSSLFVAIGTVGYIGIRLGAGATGNRFLSMLWLLSILFYLAGSLLLDRQIHAERASDSSTNGASPSPLVRPESSWPTLLGILILAGGLLTWQLGQMPVYVHESVAQNGLQSLALAQGNHSGLFRPGATGLPNVAYLPAAAMMRAVDDALMGSRFSGVVAALMTVLATWLLGCELFRRTPRPGPHATLLEDDGRWIAVMAALVVALSHVTIHYGRMGIFLAPVAAGNLGLWALLRGLRTEDRSLLVISGMLTGLAAILYPSGLGFLVITPIWWLGVWLLQRTWLQDRYRGVGALGFFLWLGGVWIVLLPVASVWISDPQTFLAFLQNYTPLTAEAQARLQTLYLTQGSDSIFLENLRLTLLTFNSVLNASALFEYPGSFLSSILAPLFVLAVGGLLLNLDRLPGWLLLSLFGGSVIMSTVEVVSPSWERLLPLLPLTGLFVAFALDRIRLTLMETLGDWIDQTAIYLAVGVIAWAGLQSWVTYYNVGMRVGDPSSYAGWGARHVPAEDLPLLLVADARGVHWNEPVVQYLTSDLAGQRPGGEVLVIEWPATLPDNGQLLIQSADRARIDEIRARYPGGTLSVVRDLRGNPVLYVYDMSSVSQEESRP